jgi:membrane protein
VNVFERIGRGWDDMIVTARRRSRAFDHFWRANERHGEVLGGRLAAAIAYYGFFAVFALALVGYAIFGFVLRSNPPVEKAVVDFLSQNLPWVQLDVVQSAVQEIQRTGGPIGIVGLIGLALTGIAWVEAIRSSQRAFYLLNQQPGNVVVRRLLDFFVMIIVFLLIAVSAAAVDLLKNQLWWLSGGGPTWLTAISAVLAVPVNMVVALALLVAVPRLRMSARRLWPPVLLVAIGFTVLNSFGRVYVQRIDSNAAYTVVSYAVGLLVYLYLLNQVLLYGAAFAATSPHGEVIDLAADPPPETDEPETDQPAGTDPPEKDPRQADPPPREKPRSEDQGYVGRR